MSTPLSILHVATGMGEGGAEAMLARLIAHSDASAVRHHLLALSQEGPLWASVGRNCSSAMNLQLDHMLATLPRLLRIGSFVSASNPDVVHGWMYHGNLAATWLRRIYAPGASLLYGVRQSLYDIGRERPMTRLIIRMGAKRSQDADAVLYNSSVSQQQHSVLGYRADRSRVIPNGFDTVKFSPNAAIRAETRARLGARDSEYLVGMVGRFHPVKDHATFLRAAARLSRENPQTRILIVGRECTPENAELRRLVERHAGGARVSLLGAWRDTEKLYPALDALCLTSLSEGFPNVVGEAMACGVVCVCTAVGDIPLLVGDASALAPAGDDAAIAAQLLRIARFDAAQQVTASNAARQRITALFGIGDIVGRYMTIYAEATASPGLRPLG